MAKKAKNITLANAAEEKHLKPYCEAAETAAEYKRAADSEMSIVERHVHCRVIHLAAAHHRHDKDAVEISRIAGVDRCERHIGVNQGKERCLGTRHPLQRADKIVMVRANIQHGAIKRCAGIYIRHAVLHPSVGRKDIHLQVVEFVDNHAFTRFADPGICLYPFAEGVAQFVAELLDLIPLRRRPAALFRHIIRIGVVQIVGV